MTALLASLFIAAHLAALLGGQHWLLVPLALLSNTMWAVVHEGIHGHLERPVARALAICFGAPFDLVKSFHLTHHQLNRIADRPDQVSTGAYYFNLIGGLYLSEVLASWLPSKLLLRLAPNEFTARAVDRMANVIASVRKDAAAVAVLYAVAFWLYGSHWYYIAAFLAVRAFLISWLDYIYHYDTPTTDVLHARNLRLPAPLQKLILNFNLHGVHHRFPYLQWFHTPSVEHSYSGSYFTAALNVFRGPIK